MIQNDLKSWQIDELVKPIAMGEGTVYLGYIVAYNYTVYLFGYNQYYDNPNNNNTPTTYVNTNKVFVLPDPSASKPGTALYGACPQILSGGSNLTMKLRTGKILPYDKVIPQMNIFQWGLESRVILVPKKVDQFYTLQVLPS